MERQAPLFLAPVELDETTEDDPSVVGFVINSALLRRIALDFPALPGSKDDFDALLGDAVFASPLGALFERVAAAINVGAPVGGKPILEDRRRLFGRVVRQRPQRARAPAQSVGLSRPQSKTRSSACWRWARRRPARTRIVEGEFDSKGARSRPDKIQALAVKASLGGTSFVFEGPPGTGKTQTIAAMVEALAKQGKRVLVSAAMPGAVEVIGRRLAGVGSFWHQLIARWPDRCRQEHSEDRSADREMLTSLSARRWR